VCHPGCTLPLAFPQGEAPRPEPDQWVRRLRAAEGTRGEDWVSAFPGMPSGGKGKRPRKGGIPYG